MKKYLFIALLLISLTSCGQEVTTIKNGVVTQNERNKQTGDYTMLYTALTNKDISKMSEKVYFENDISVDTENYIYIKDISDLSNIDNIDGLQEGKAIVFVVDTENTLNKNGITKITKDEYQGLPELTTGFVILGPKAKNVNIPNFFKSPQVIEGKKYNGVFIESN